MIDKRVENVEQALDGLTDGATIMMSGFGGTGIPHTLTTALGATSIGNLTLITNGVRHTEDCAPALFEDKRVAKVIVSAARSRGREPTTSERQLEDGTLELELVPQGTFAERMRAAGAGIPAFYTPTGLGTKLTEGKEVREFNGRQYVLEAALGADFAFIGVERADRWGNVSFRGTQENFGPAMAMGSRIAIVEARHVTDEPIPPREVDIPGIYVQRVLQIPA
jgi:3-oxoadipate CoA-transferase, alpha subunit